MQKKVHDQKDSGKENCFAGTGLPHLRMMTATIQEIHDTCAIREMSHVTVTSFENDPLRNSRARNEAIEFLTKKRVIEVCLQKHKKFYARWDIKVVDQEALTECAKQLKTAMASCLRHKTSSVPQNNFVKDKSSPIVECPPETKWSDIELEFLNAQTILVKIGRFRKRYSYDALRFVDGRSSKPNKQWVLLELLSRTQGEMSWSDSRATKEWKKHKSLLSKTLQDRFGINDAPFFPYKDRGSKDPGSYRLKFKKIIPC